MNHLKTIRRMLGVTQAQLAVVLGCTQPNVSLHERSPNSTLSVEKGKRLMDHCNTNGLKVTLDHIFGDADPSKLSLPKQRKGSKTKAAQVSK